MHELTERINKRVVLRNAEEDVDSIIREYLSEKAEIMYKKYDLAYRAGIKDVRETLGLSETQETTTEPVPCPHPGTCQEREEKKKKTSWQCCRAFTFGNFCGSCGKPRPEALSKCLMKYLNEKHQCSISIRVAESAVEFMEKEGWHK